MFTAQLSRPLRTKTHRNCRSLHGIRTRLFTAAYLDFAAFESTNASNVVKADATSGSSFCDTTDCQTIREIYDYRGEYHFSK